MHNKKNLAILAENFAVIHKSCFGSPSAFFSSSFILSLIQNPNVKFINEGQKGFCLVRRSDEEAEIITMAVKPEFQQQGVGYSMLRKAILLLSKTNCEQIFLEVASDNIAGIKLYSKAGFHSCGIRKNYYHISNHEIVDAITMTKNLVK